MMMLVWSSFEFPYRAHPADLSKLVRASHYYYAISYLLSFKRPQVFSNFLHRRGSWWLLCKKSKISQSYSWEGIMQALPTVTHGKDLCKTHHQWWGIMQVLICIKSWLVDYLKGRIYTKRKKSRYLAISLKMTMNLITTF